MIKRFASVCCLFAIICAAGGCRLAKEESGTAGEDRMIGVLITTEYLDLFDFEAYMEENIGLFVEGGDITSEGINGKYSGRLYATQTTTGNYTEYVFDGVDGIRYFVVDVPTESAGSYQACVSDNGVSDGHIALNTHDEGNSVVLEGTIYVAAAAGRTFYFNPVYQDAAGNVYVTAGSGVSQSGSIAEGTSFSQNYEESHTVTENGKQTTDDISVTITVSVKYVPEKLVIVQMGDDHSVIARDEYAPGNAPESVTPKKGAAYIISESYAVDAEGKTQVIRSLHSEDADYIRSYYDRGDGILVMQDIRLDW